MSTSTPGVESSFFVAGGTLGRDARSYVARQADKDLYAALMAGKFCYVLTSRQMGKSSLMVRTAVRLREEGVKVAVLDLTSLGLNLTATQWYLGLLSQMGEQLGLELELEDFWEAHSELGPLQRWMRGIREVIVEKCPGRVVVFVDEIDVTRSLPFSTDEFFAGIREFYNRRAGDPVLERLTFCLLGVATPSDLIRDVRMTPFNIGQRIELTDFSDNEAVTLLPGLRRPGDAGHAVLKRILYWTGGHPNLTQRLCQAVADDPGVHNAGGVDRVCENLFFSASAREKDDNLVFVRDRILRSEADHAALLDIYQRIRGHERVKDDVAHPLLSILRLSGITRIKEGYLYVRNRVYYRVFDKEWVQSNLPVDEVARQRAAVRRALIKTISIAALVFLALSGLAIYAWDQKQQVGKVNKRLEKTIDDLNTANKSLDDKSKEVANTNTALEKTNVQLNQEEGRLNKANAILLEDHKRETKMTADAEAMAATSKVLQKKAEDLAKEAERQKGIADQNVSRLVGSLDNSKQVALTIDKYAKNDLANFVPIWQQNLKFFDQMRDLGSEQSRLDNVKVLHYLLLCDSYRAKNDNKLAAEACDNGIKIGKENAKDASIKDAKFYLFLLYERKGSIAQHNNQYAESKSAFTDCLHMAEEIAKDGTTDGIDDEWYAYGHLGDIEATLGNRETAQKDYDQQLELAKQLAAKEKSEQRNLWQTYKRIGDFRRKDNTPEGRLVALKAYQDSLPIAGAMAKDAETWGTQGKQDLWSTHINVGEVLRDLKRTNEAIPPFETSLKVAQEQLPQRDSDTQLDILVSYERIGDAYLALGKMQEALDAFQKSFDIALKRTKSNSNDVQESVAISYLKMASIHAAMGHLPEARRNLDERIQVFSTLAAENPEGPDRVTEQRNLATAYKDLGDFEIAHNFPDAARAAYQKQVAVLKELAKDPKDSRAKADLAGAFGNLSWFEVLQAQYRAAIDAANAGLAADPSQTWIKVNLAHGYLFSKQIEEARKLYFGNRDLPVQGTKTFLEDVLEDFQELRKRGVKNPEMDAIEKELKAGDNRGKAELRPAGVPRGPGIVRAG